MKFSVLTPNNQLVNSTELVTTVYYDRKKCLRIHSQVDGNWYEGERNAMIGILPISYVEIVPAMDANTLQSRWVPTQTVLKWRRDAQHNDGIQHNGLFETIAMILQIFKLSVIRLRVVMPRAVMLCLVLLR